MNGCKGPRPGGPRHGLGAWPAATAFWNVDGLVKFACAQDGAVLYFDEFAFDEERRGLPMGSCR